MLDPPDVMAMAEAVADAAAAAAGVLLIYYAGHGLIGPGGDLYLSASGTGELTPGLAAHQALPFAMIAEAITACRAASVAVILDCCFSGRAVLGWRPADPSFTLPATHGLYLLASAERLALAPEDQQFTLFTGALISLLTDGDPRGPRLLTLDDAYEHTFRAMRESGGPLPRRQAGDRSGELVLTGNPAWPTPAEELAEARDSAGAGWCPYLGLSAFTLDDAPLFRGREEAIIALGAAAADAMTAGSPLIVVGASGAGKTSLLHAGLLARLRECPAELPGAAAWPVITTTPGDHPLQTLARRGLEHLASDLVLIVDQLEQVFMPRVSASERSRFLSCLQAMAQPATGKQHRALVVLALRADFYSQAAQCPELFDALATSQYLISPMIPAELRAVIEEPADAAGLRLDDGLADLILDELSAVDGGQPGPGILPLLSHALWAIWQRRSGDRLTFGGYKSAGRVAGAIAESADQAYRALSEGQQEAARRLLPRLVRVGDADDVPDTIRELRADSLLNGLPDHQAAREALSLLAAARLVTLGAEGVRLSHEAVFRSWPLLAGWVKADRDWLRAAQRLADDARAWQTSSKDRSRLYRGGILAEVTSKVDNAGRKAELSADTAEFLDASARQERRVDRIRRTAITVLSVLLVMVLAGAGTTVAYQRQAVAQRNEALGELVAAEAAQLRLTDPNLATQLSIAAYQIDPSAGAAAVIASQGSPGVLDDGTPAIDMAETDRGRVLIVSTGAGIQVLNRQNGAVLSTVDGIASGPIATASTAPILVAAVGAASALYPLEASVHEGGLSSVLNKLAIWNLADPARPQLMATVPARAPNVITVAVSSDGRLIAVGAINGSIHLWNSSNPAHPVLVASLRGDGKPVYSVAFQPGDRILASTAGDHKVRLWDLSPGRAGFVTPRLVAAIPASTAAPDSLSPATPHRIAFSPDGRYLAIVAGSDDGEFPEVWDIKAPRAPRLLATAPSTSAYCESVIGLAFGTDTGLMASCDSELDGWEVVPGQQPGTDQLQQVLTFPQDQDPGATGGQVIVEQGRHTALDVTADGVQILQLNSIEPGALASLPGSTGLSAGTLAVNPAGTPLLADTDYLPYIRLTNLSDPSDLKVVGVYSELVPSGRNVQAEAQTNSDALDGDGSLLAAGEVVNGSPAVVLRRISKSGATQVATIRGFSDGAISLALSSDGRLLAVADNAGITPDRGLARPPAVKLFNLADLAHPQLLGTLPGNTFQVLISPDNHLLVALTANMMLSWDISNPRRPLPLPTRLLSSSSTDAQGAFSPDGTLFAVADSAGVLRLWHLVKDRIIGDPVVLGEHPDAGTAVAFSPDGQTLATGDLPAGFNSDPVVDLWNVSDPSSPKLAAQWPQLSQDSVYGLAFTSTGVLAVEGNEDVTFWSTDPASVATNLCKSAGDQITLTEWERYIPGIPYQPPCGSP